MAENLFGQSRFRLTMLYSLVMIIFLAVLIFAMHQSMDWSIRSEQARELWDTADNVAEAQKYLNQHPELVIDDTLAYKNTNDRLFFYVFDEEGRLLNFARASFRIEPFILDVMAQWQAPDGDVVVVTKPRENGHKSEIMMTSQKITESSGKVQRVYVGKDVTALYNGMEKATTIMAGLGLLALIIATIVGHILSGKAMVPLKAAYEKQRQFAADASHELRTPLAVVMASAELLQNDPSIKSPFLKQVVEDVHDEVKKMTKLVGDLLVVARSDNKALKLKPSKFDLGAVAAQTARLMQPLAEQKNIAIIAENLPKTMIHADEQKIRQLVLILVDNAVKYTPDGGKVTLEFRKAEKGKVCLAVSDTGIGIAPEDQEKVFDRFYRVDKARSREMGGNGLGLAIAQEIVELHHGTIAIDSVLGQGTTFTITLKTKIKGKTLHMF
ncbi:MAG: two-component sensor histidine kinase [Selenomonas sp.]|jgi:signal transduction histidine kinase|uniref:sensor histidine kinase n=1 Tax=Selenomonas sp. AE3005 TaxID=1485543 RepID=UPI0004827853|nr:ATP-binding protein [Selenomonas sp. AE3005]MBQ1417020.1 two-component sensor histidine kinase [Selenomonas sp.]MBQ1615424.1 two-component sensor histidine kinase [Selenomonas sp.]MBQ2088337.1 two-component sensor histidine kinase [Selenomonas sp.]MBQ4212632.1 two-component sensor histidine kinase [Selenomonas sp.]MBQ5419599.1 two-component sensor histidine kinase [Selenomonas sp.]